jgi:hypothetical protein
MTTIQPNFTALSSDRSTIVGCHNLSSARAYASGRVPEGLRPFKKDPKLPVWAYRSPTGQYYVATRCTGIRIDCHNQATARYYFKNGVSASLVASASISEVK